MNSVLGGAVAVFVLFLLMAAAIGIAVHRIKRKIRSFSRMAWGTERISEGVEKMRVEYAATPKSVSAMTSLYLPKIHADFPEFQYDEMKRRAENVLVCYLMAIDRGKAGILQDANRQLKDKVQAVIDMQAASGRREHFQSVRVHRTEIATYRKMPGRCIIAFQSSLQYIHGITDENGGEGMRMDRLPTQTKYDVDMVYIQDEGMVEDARDYGLGLNCPNCGAPIPALGAKVCEYCGTPVVELNLRVWTFGDVREVKTTGGAG